MTRPMTGTPSSFTYIATARLIISSGVPDGMIDRNDIRMSRWLATCRTFNRAAQRSITKYNQYCGYVSTELTVILLSHIYSTDISLGGHGVKK